MKDELPSELVDAVHPDALYWPAEEPPGQTPEPAAADSEDRAVVLAPHAPVLAGTFALYATPEGGFVLVTDSARGIEHHVMPAAMVKMAMAVAGGAGGPFGAMFRKLAGG